MSQTVAGDWNVALPRLSTAPSGSVLPVVVGDATFAIPLDRVRYVDYPEKVMRLPLATAPVEGLAIFNHRPLVQINVAQTLNLKSKNDIGRIVVIGFAQGEVALRVDEVLGFVSVQAIAQNNGKYDAVTADSINTHDMPLLKLEDILPWLDAGSNAISVVSNVPATEVQKVSARTNYSGHVLLVATGTQTIALLANGVDRIEEIDTTLALRYPETDADGIIKIENYLFPSRSLARILKCQSDAENYALIVHGAQQPWALLVEKVLRLEHVDCLHTVVSPSGERSVWYLNDEGKVVEVIDVREFFGVLSKQDKLSIVAPQWNRDNLPKMSSDLSIEGIRINCGETICILPLSLVKRTIGSLGDMSQSHQGTEHEGLVPIVDGTMLLEQHHKKGENCNILLSLCNEQQAVLSVDSASLQSTLSLGQWMPIAALPPPASFLFDAAIYDEAEGRWILRVKENLDSFMDVWSSKRALVSSMLGWIEPSNLDAKTAH